MVRAAINRQTFHQMVKYACVGALNTFLTLCVIVLCKDFLAINVWVSNGIGYIVGFINSFLWNKHWVFRSHKNLFNEMLRFITGFLVCYAIQLLVTWLLAEHTALKGFEISIWMYVLSGYGIATLIGMVVYTIANFMFNKFITFKS
ncbi:MAG: GtrA family protein [Paramuribaculum sp.]|nr:GtrA family protein [Paramuribaculum sp.]